MNAMERRSVQRKSMQRNGCIGFACLVALAAGGVSLLSASLSLFFVVLLAALLCGAFAVGFALLPAKLRVRAEHRGLLAGEDCRKQASGGCLRGPESLSHPA